MEALNLLVLSDLHYTGLARHACAADSRRAPLGRLLLRRALARMRREGMPVDALVLLGDLVDNGCATDAAADLQVLAGEVLRTGLPVLAVPGNHDGDPALYGRLFGCGPGLHRIGRYGLLIFHDQPVAGEVYARAPEDLALPAQVAADHPDLTLVALQHTPLHPDIVSAYPYMLANRADVLGSYRAGRVALSLSGHFHAGQAAHDVDGCTVCTAPALVEAPFRFLHVRLEGRVASVRELALQMPVEGLADVHCHTEFAYCATTVDAAHAVMLSAALGLSRLCLVEHAFHLYFPREEAWAFRWQRDPSLAAGAWQQPGHGRLAAYRAFAATFRGPGVRLGLEVDLLGDGRLLLAPDDAAGWDLLVGAIHEIPEFVRGVTGQAEAEALFMRDLERLLRHPIQVLAHPFRFFSRKGIAKPETLFVPVARLLAAAGVAAEINFHTNSPEPAFLRACLDQGARLALGSDAHELAEVADFHPHLALLAEVGVPPERLAEVLYTPP